MSSCPDGCGFDEADDPIDPFERARHNDDAELERHRLDVLGSMLLEVTRRSLKEARDRTLEAEAALAQAHDHAVDMRDALEWWTAKLEEVVRLKSAASETERPDPYEEDPGACRGCGGAGCEECH